MIPVERIHSALALMQRNAPAGQRDLLDALTPLIAIKLPPTRWWAKDERDFETYKQKYSMHWYVAWGAVLERLHRWIVDQAHKHPADDIERRALDVIEKGYRRTREKKPAKGVVGVVIAADDKDTMGISETTIRKMKANDNPLFPIKDRHGKTIILDQVDEDHRRRQLDRKSRYNLMHWATTELQRAIATLAHNELTDEEIATELGTTVARVRQAITYMQRRAYPVTAA